MTLGAAVHAVVEREAPLRIAAEHCKGCGLCVAVCPSAVLALDLDTVNGLGHHPIRSSTRPAARAAPSAPGSAPMPCSP